MYVDNRALPVEPIESTVCPNSSSVRRTRQLHELTSIFEPEVNIAVLERSLAACFQVELAQAMNEILGEHLMLTVGSTAHGRRELREHLRAVPSLAEDIEVAVELLADLTGASMVGVRLTRLDRAMCPRLHVDRVTLRSVVTYIGPGTQYVDGMVFDRRSLAASDRHASQTEAQRDAAPIEQAATGDMVFLKGEGWPGNTGRGAVHRSPPASRQAPRLVLTLDPL